MKADCTRTFAMAETWNEMCQRLRKEYDVEQDKLVEQSVKEATDAICEEIVLRLKESHGKEAIVNLQKLLYDKYKNDRIANNTMNRVIDIATANGMKATERKECKETVLTATGLKHAYVCMLKVVPQ
jgi:hypothetical protein